MQIHELQQFYADIVFQDPDTIGGVTLRRESVKTLTLSCLPFISFRFIFL
jgi:hypothetical protein